MTPQQLKKALAGIRCDSNACDGDACSFCPIPMKKGDAVYCVNPSERVVPFLYACQPCAERIVQERAAKVAA